MTEQPAPLMPDFPLPYLPEEHPPKKTRKRYKQVVLLFSIVGLVLVVATSAYLLMHRSAASDAPTIRSVTYYYRDGKTILWQGARLAEADSPTFVHAVADELIARYSSTTFEQSGEWKIVTTLDQPLQGSAKQQVEAQREKLLRQGATDAALIAQDVTTGQVVAWVSGLEDQVSTNGKSRLNTKTEPGTLVLPLVYAAYIENNPSVGAETIVDDTQQLLPGYDCMPTTSFCLQNYDRKYQGKIALRRALGGLRTVPAVMAMTSLIPNDTSRDRLASIDKTLTTIQAMMGDDGYDRYSCYEPGTYVPDTPDNERGTQCYAASAIGDAAHAKPADVINAFGTLSNNGKRLPQTLFLRLQKDGKTVDEWKLSDGEQVVSQNTAHIINDILSDQSNSYLPIKSYFNVDGGTKVSTIAGVSSAAYTFGAVQYTAKYAVGFWGFSDTTAISGFGETFTLPATHGWLTAAYDNQE